MMIKCTMCGEEKDKEEFRVQKANSKRGEYRRPYCKDCETIEVRRQYLLSFADLPPERQEELNQINELYRLRQANGLRTFGNRKCHKGTTTDLIAGQLSKLKERSNA